MNPSSANTRVRLKLPDGKEAEFELVPFAAETEHFSLYRPLVEADHPLAGRLVKVKTVVMRMHYGGTDERGEPIVNVFSQTLVTVE